MKHIARCYNDMRDRDKILSRGAVSIYTLLIFIVLLSFPDAAFSARESRSVDKGRYVISLFSDTKPIKTSAIRTRETFKGHTLYTTKFRKDGVTWHRLRLGFFPTRQAADREMRLLKGSFKDAWVTMVSVKERERADATAITSERRVASATKKEKKITTISEHPTSALKETGRAIAEKTGEFTGAAKETGEKFAHWSKKKYAGIDKGVRKKLDDIKAKHKESKERKEKEKAAKKSTAKKSVKKSSEKKNGKQSPIFGKKDKKPSSPVGKVQVEKGRYVVSLFSDTKPIKTSALRRQKAFKGHTLYTTKLTRKGVTWHRLRLGFFPTKQAAEREMRLLKHSFKDAWVTMVSVKERERVYATVTKNKRRTASLKKRDTKKEKKRDEKIAKKSEHPTSTIKKTGEKFAGWTKKTYTGLDEGFKKKIAEMKKNFNESTARPLTDEDESWSASETTDSKDWVVIKKGETFTFNHFKTGFPLENAHVFVKCESCHARGIFSNTPSECAKCHTQGSIVKASAKHVDHLRTNAPCEACHTTKNWTLSRFRHTAETFGRCQSCHNGSDNVGKPITHVQSGNNCEDCHSTSSWLTARFDHSNITSSCITCHNGSKATGKPVSHVVSSNNCDDCHTTNGWIPAGFDHGNITASCVTCHNGTQAPGKSPDHVQSSNVCDDCHSTRAWIPAGFDHGNITSPCANCHNGTTATGKPAGHVQSSNICDDCHSTKAWIPAGFDHSNITSPCANCHNGTTATGKPAGHVQSSNICDDCHSTNAWIPAGFNHNNITSPCANCHNGTTATGKNPGHIQSSNICDDCHSTNAWIPATFDHTGVTGSCSSCHNGTKATGKPGGHFVTSEECNACHTTRGWIPTTSYNHISPAYPGDHRSRVKCLDCHTSNSQTITYAYGGYKPDCAACHAGSYKRKSHKKTSNPTNIYYTENELRNCAGSCHKYTDNTFTTISKTRNSKHRVSDGGW